MPTPESAGDERRDRPPAKQKPLYLRIYFETVYTEFVRFIGYDGKRLAEAQQFVLELEQKHGRDKVIEAGEAVSTCEGKADNQTVRLTAEARRLAWQLLGPPPEHKPKDLIADNKGKAQQLKPGAKLIPVKKPRKAQRAEPKSTSASAIDHPSGQKATDDLTLHQADKRCALPVMEQYREAKERHPGMLLLFRMGDFYELFSEDAETAAKLLGLTLTTRDRTVSMAGFPHHSLETYLRKLLQAGQRVAICEQVDTDAGAAGQARRDVTRVVSPGSPSKPSRRAHDRP